MVQTQVGLAQMAEIIESVTELDERRVGWGLLEEHAMAFRSNIVPPPGPSQTSFVSRPLPTISPPIHRAKTIGNNPSDLACRTKLEAVVQGDLEKLTEHWSMGWHRVTFYGDLQPHVKELCAQLKLQLVEEA